MLHERTHHEGNGVTGSEYVEDLTGLIVTVVYDLT